MSYTVYAKLSDGRTIRYGKNLNSPSEVNSAMDELRHDLKEAGLSGKVLYKNNNPAPSSAPRMTGTATKPKTVAKPKAIKVNPMNAKMLDLMKAKYDREPTGYHAHNFARHNTLRKNREALKYVKPTATLGQTVDAMNQGKDVFYLLTGRTLDQLRDDRAFEVIESIENMVIGVVAQKLHIRSYDVSSSWDPYGYRELGMWKDQKKPLAVKQPERIAPGELPKVGTVFVASWGYDQTNVDFYLVDKTKGTSMLHIIPIYETSVSRGGPAGDTVIADPKHVRPFDVLIGKERGDPPTKGKWCKYDPKYKSVLLSDRTHAYLWDGKPMYQTDPMFGH